MSTKDTYKHKTATIDTNTAYDNITMLANRYINHELVRPEDINNSYAFGGMIKYISININITKNQLADLVLLNTLWNIYVYLCGKYKQLVTITRYCVLIGIVQDTFYQWLRGDTRVDYCGELNVSRSDLLKKWHADMVGSVEDGVSGNNVGVMYYSKAKLGWQENKQEVIHTHRIEKTAEQIAQDYDIPLIETTTI